MLLVLDPVALAAELVPQHRHRPQLGVLLDEPHAGVDEERNPAEHAGHEALVDPPLDRVEHGDRVAHRERDLLHGRRARLLEVIGADVDRVPLRDVLHRVGDRVGDQAHARAGRERVGAAAQILLEDVVLGGALKLLLRDAVLLGGDHVERQQPRRGGVDRHRGVHLIERDAVEQRGHVAPVRDRDADLAHLTASQFVVGVIAGLGRQVERDRQAGLALLEVAPVELVGPPGVGVAGVGPHHPGAVRLGEAGRRCLRGHGAADCMNDRLRRRRRNGVRDR